jgi:hypothetical protein
MNESSKTRSENHSPSCYDNLINILPGILRLSKIAFVVISGFRREVAENLALVGYYAASSGNFLLMFRDNLSVPSSGFKNSFATDGTDRFSRKFGKNLPLLDQTFCHFPTHTELLSYQIFLVELPWQRSSRCRLKE